MDVLLLKLLLLKPQAIRNQEIKDFLMMLTNFAVFLKRNTPMPQPEEDKN
jgi:hypothetical protein